MKSIWTIAFTAFLVKCATTLSVSAQGSMTYISSLNGPSGGAVAIASDSWFAQGFRTGTNTLGYSLESVSLLMANASGDPSGFMVSLYTRGENLFPGSSVGSLSGSFDPVFAGTSSFTRTQPLILAPATGYFVVVTASQPIGSGSYRWSCMAPSTNPPVVSVDGWLLGTAGQSIDGVTWERAGGSTISGLFQFSISAVAIPEPSSIALYVLGAGFFANLFRRPGSIRSCNPPVPI
jgi:hypothetical protein